jgi:hypothetical protein
VSLPVISGKDFLEITRLGTGLGMGTVSVTKPGTGTLGRFKPKVKGRKAMVLFVTL